MKTLNNTLNKIKILEKKSPSDILWKQSKPPSPTRITVGRQ